jgi:hypothetical protein
MLSPDINRIERRRHAREKIDKDYALRLDPRDGREPMKCFIWDISEVGARLTLTKSAKMRRKMTALIGNVKRPVRVVWRKENQIGIEFLAMEERAYLDPLVSPEL